MKHTYQISSKAKILSISEGSNLKSQIFIIVSALFLSACSYTGPAATSTSTTPVTPPSVVTASPTAATTDVNKLSAQLDATVDDGGAADLNQLQKDSSGL